MRKLIVKPFLIRKMNKLYKKELYGSDKVAIFIQSFDRKDSEGQITNQVFSKLDYLARRGFDIDGSNIKYYKEYNVYRIRVKGGKQDGRIIGFYDNEKFIAICSFFKNKQKLDKKQLQVIKKVATIFRDNQWMYGIGG